MTTPARCVARRSNGEPCGRWPTRGATVCAKHGAGAPHVKAAAAERRLEQQARQALAQLGVEPVDDPLTALAQLAGEVVQWKDALAARVNALREIRYEAHGAGTEQLRAEVALFERAMDRCVQVLAVMAKLNLDERLARISELQAAAVVAALDAGLTHLATAVQIPRETADEARQVVARHLRSVGS